MKQIGRNQPCWCGSQKKYKHCHLKLDQEESLAKPIISRSAEYIEGMVQSNILAKKTIQMLERFIQSETTTNKLNNLAHQLKTLIKLGFSITNSFFSNNIKIANTSFSFAK